MKQRLTAELRETMRFINPCVTADSIAVGEDWRTITKRGFAPRSKGTSWLAWIHGEQGDCMAKEEEEDTGVNGLLSSLDDLKTQRSELKAQLNRPEASPAGTAHCRVIHSLVNELSKEVARRERQSPLNVGYHYELDRLEAIQKLSRCLNEMNFSSASSILA